jgi:hypothetical protein
LKNGSTSLVPIIGKAKPVVTVNPPDSIVCKVIVGYDEKDFTTGF